VYAIWDEMDKTIRYPSEVVIQDGDGLEDVCPDRLLSDRNHDD